MSECASSVRGAIIRKEARTRKWSLSEPARTGAGWIPGVRFRLGAAVSRSFRALPLFAFRRVSLFGLAAGIDRARTGRFVEGAVLGHHGAAGTDDAARLDEVLQGRLHRLEQIGVALPPLAELDRVLEREPRLLEQLDEEADRVRLELGVHPADHLAE